jgi:hypothetical protein
LVQDAPWVALRAFAFLDKHRVAGFCHVQVHVAPDVWGEHVMADAAAQSLTQETEADRLRALLTQAQGELERHIAALLKLQGELMASRIEVSGARGETVQYQGFLRRAEADIAAAQAREMALAGEVAALTRHAETLEAGLQAVRASLSWRVSSPVRLIGRFVGRSRSGR